MYSQIIKSKLEELPENLEKEVLDYVEFLLHKYGNIEPIYSEAEKIKQKRIDTAKALLSEVDDIDDDSQGIFDASADIRRLREERLKQIC
jgi:hypothetical protein